MTIFWPGTMPAEMLTWGPTRVSRPRWIHRSPKIAPGGKARQLPEPNAPNRAARRSPGPMAPCRAVQLQPALIDELSQRRRTGRIGGSDPGCLGRRGSGPVASATTGRVRDRRPGAELASVTSRRYLILRSGVRARSSGSPPVRSVPGGRSRRLDRRRPLNRVAPCRVATRPVTTDREAARPGRIRDRVGHLRAGPTRLSRRTPSPTSRPRPGSPAGHGCSTWPPEPAS